MQVLENPIIHVSDLHYNDNLTCYYTGGIALAILKHCQPEHLSLGLQMEALKTLKMAQLISIGKTSPLAKYTHPLLIYLFKSTSYHAFISAYPQSTELLHEIYDKERQTLSAEKNYLCNTLKVRIKRHQCPNIRRRDFDVLGPATTVHEGTGS